MLVEGHSPERANINLARIAPFCLNSLKVTPATRQIERGGKSETLEPRIMQVLVALRQAHGAVVTRDDLTASCWDGRIVGDNAIQRAISRLREIAAGMGAGCFQLETVSKVGYRLVELGPAPAMEQTVAGATAGLDRRVTTVVAAAVAAVIVAGAVILWKRSSVSGSATIAVVATQGQDSRDHLVNGLAVDLARLANAHGGGISFVNGKRADYRLIVSERRAGHRVEADVSLSRASFADILWSATFAAPLSDPALLRDRIAIAVSAVTQCAMQTNNDPARSPRVALPSVFSACETLNEDADAHTVEQWRRAVASEPDNAPAIATLAFVEAAWSVDAGRPAEAVALRAAARQHLRQARSINSSLGLTYAAEALLMPVSRYGDQLATLEHGIALDPACAALHRLSVLALQRVGRMDDAIASAREAVRLEPGSASHRAELATTLAYSGFKETARTELETAERIWPSSAAVRDARSRYEFRLGDPNKLIRTIDGGNAMPYNPSVYQAGWQRAFLLARANPSPQNIENAMRIHLRCCWPQGWLQTFVALGHVDQAYALMNDPRGITRLQEDTYILFRTNMRPFLLDRRFMLLAKKLGLVRFWQSSGVWPDFCDDKDMAYDCKAEARRLLH